MGSCNSCNSYNSCYNRGDQPGLPQLAKFFAFRAAPCPHRCCHTCVNASTLPPYFSPAPLSQGWLGRSDHPLYEGHAVQLVRWSDALVAWASEKAVTVSGAVGGACVWGDQHAPPYPYLDPDILTGLHCALLTPRCTTPTHTSRSGPSAGTRPSLAAAARSAPAASFRQQRRLGRCQQGLLQGQGQQGQGPEPGCLPRFLRGVFRCCLVTIAASSSAGRTASRWGGRGERGREGEREGFEGGKRGSCRALDVRA